MGWIAAIFELLGSWTIGNKKRIGFIFVIIGCFCWVYYSFTKPAYELLLVVCPAIIVNLRNYIKWSKHVKN